MLAEMCPFATPQLQPSYRSSARRILPSLLANCTMTSRGLLLGLVPLLLSITSGVTAQVAEIEKASNESLLWGPYRPNLYFGVRPRIPKSLMGGLLWTRVEDYQSVQTSKAVLHKSWDSVD